MNRMRACAGLLALGVICMTAGAASAQAFAPPNAPTASASVEAAPTRPWLAQAAKPVVAGDSAQVPWRSVVLFVGIIAMGAFAWHHRSKWRSATHGKPNAKLSIIGSVRVGPRAHLVLAAVGDRALLLGVTDDSVRRIAWIDQPALAVEEQPRAPGSGESPAAEPLRERTFVEVLRNLHTRPDRSEPAPRAMVNAALEAAAEESPDTVEWSRGASRARGRPSASPRSAAPSEPAKPTATSRARAVPPHDLDSDIEEQAAGVALRKGRRRT
jgi:flagellar biogenesis protein FliO